LPSQARIAGPYRQQSAVGRWHRQALDEAASVRGLSWISVDHRRRPADCLVTGRNLACGAMLLPRSVAVDRVREKYPGAGHVPATPLGVMFTHLRQTLFVRLALLPFLQEWIEHHREIETDQKSPHGIPFWRTVMPRMPAARGGGRIGLSKHEPAPAATAHS